MTPRAMPAALALVALLPSLAAASPFEVVRVAEPATLTQGGDTKTLAAPLTLAAGDVLSAGARGKVALRFAGGSFTLSSLGDLQVFETTPARGAQPAVARLKLLGGALRVDGRGKPAQDIRLNVGSLKTRIANAHVWAANTAEGDTVCALAGAVSVQTDGQSEERLTSPGSCLRREPDGQISRFAASADVAVTGAMEATRFADAPSVLAAGAVVAAKPAVAVAASVSTPAPAPIIAAAPAKPAAPAPAAAMPPPSKPTPPPAAAPTPAADAKGWTVVVLSLNRPEPVAAHAQALTAKGLPAATRQVNVNGAAMHRVVVGQFATQAEARSYAAGPLARAGLKGWAAAL